MHPAHVKISDRLALGLIAVFAFFSLVFSGPQPASAESPPTRESIIRETNKARAGKGLSPLIESGLLNRIAEERLQDMIEKQYFGHVSSSGEMVDAAARREGYDYRKIGENLGKIYPKATGSQFVSGWMNSPPHRKNILNPDYREIGVAVRKARLKGTESWIAVQIFGKRNPSGE